LPGSNLVNWRRPWGRRALDPRVHRLHHPSSSAAADPSGSRQELELLRQIRRHQTKIFDSSIRSFNSAIKIFESYGEIFESITMTFESIAMIFDFIAMIFEFIATTFESITKIFDAAIMVFDATIMVFDSISDMVFDSVSDAKFDPCDQRFEFRPEKSNVVRISPISVGTGK
jgi:hypothetical protein